MVYALFTDSTFRSSNAFVSQFETQAEFMEACEDQAGYYDGKEISKERYDEIMASETEES